VFTKYDLFLFNIEMDVLDDPFSYPDGDVYRVAEDRFRQHYLNPLGDDVRFVRLESGFGDIYQGHDSELMFFGRNAHGR
jgi:hypothetical protein